MSDLRISHNFAGMIIGPDRSCDGMQRGLFFFERFLLVGGRRPWNVLLAARLAGTIEAADLHRALVQLQARHPMLCVGIVQKGKRPHFVTPDPIPPIGLRIIERTDDGDWFEAVRHEIDLPFDNAHGPLLRVVWIRSPAVSELVLVGYHCICDGKSMLLLTRELIVELGDIRQEPVPVRPAPRRIATIHELFTEDRRLSRRWRSLLSHASAAKWLLHAATGLARRGPAAAVLPSYVIRWTLEASTCDALRARCRDETVTLYAVLATAFLRAVREVRPVQARNRLLCPIDVRPMLPAIEADMLFGYPDTVHLSVDRGLDQGFWQQARKLKRDLTARRGRLDPRRTLLTAEWLHALSDWFIDLQLHGKARNDLMFSHVGEAVVPPGASVLGFLSSMPWRGTTAVFSLLDQGCMRFFLVAREASLSSADAERIRACAMSLLDAELGVPAQAAHRRGRERSTR
jgi:hypothetical protein